MDFFKKIGFRIRLKFILTLIFSTIFTGFMTYLYIAYRIDGNQKDATHCGIIVIAGIIAIVCTIITLVGNKEYKDLINSAKRVGELDEVGKMLEEMPRSFYTKESVDLRVNERIIFVDTGFSGGVCIILPEQIIEISAVKRRGAKGGWMYLVVVNTKHGYTSIQTSNEDEAMKLCEEMKNYYAEQLKAAEAELSLPFWQRKIR